jgi:hypothetical protein
MLMKIKGVIENEGREEKRDHRLGKKNSAW